MSLRHRDAAESRPFDRFQNRAAVPRLLVDHLVAWCSELTFAGRRSASREKASGAALGLRATLRRTDFDERRRYNPPVSFRGSGEFAGASRPWFRLGGRFRL